MKPSEIKLNERHDVEALIGNPPSWTLRWGPTVLLAALLLLLGIAHFVRYPDVVEARAVLTTERPPIRLVAGASGKIAELRVQNGQAVQPGDLLAVLDNPARLPDVLVLDSLLRKMAEPDAALDEAPPTDLRLGGLQTSYASFAKQLEELQYFLRQNANFLKISNLRRQVQEVVQLNRSLERQGKILADEVAIARRNLDRDSILLRTNGISQLEYDRSEAAWLAKRRELEQLQSTASLNNLKMHEMQSQIIDLQQIQSDDGSKKMLDFRSEVQRLQGEVDAWKETFLLVAPVPGEVALTKAWSEQQHVAEGEEVLTIVPKEGSGEVVAKATLTGAGSGKVQTGMAAHLRLDGFPYQEFGTLDGRVGRIAAVPTGEGYEVEIQLVGKMKTSHGKEIPFRQEMQATARIVTEERSLLQRLFERVMSYER